MEVNPILFWNGLLTLVIAPAIWVFRSVLMEMKRLDILLNKTREEYAKRDDVKEDMHIVMDALQRLEDKLSFQLDPIKVAKNAYTSALIKSLEEKDEFKTKEEAKQ